MKIQYAILGYCILIAAYGASIYVLSSSERTAPLQHEGPGLTVVPGEFIRAPIDLQETIDTNPSTLPVPIATAEASETQKISETTFRYIKVTDGCSAYYEGACVNVRSAPGTSSPVVAKLRSGAVLRISNTVSHEGRDWHAIVFDEWIRYPERIADAWYIAADYVEIFEDAGPLEISSTTPTSTKSILIDRSEQKLYAYDGEILFMEESVSTGHETTPTPRGTFTIFRKTPSRYMQGPLPDISEDYYDLPGVPWNLYFTAEGAAIHGAYWHDKFGQRWSHGCVNLKPDTAQKLYTWADLGTIVTVRD